MRLKSTAFPEGGTIPRQFTRDADDVSPPLVWEDEPRETRSYALIVDDPDAPRGTWNHWLVWNLAPDLHALPKGYDVVEPAQCGTNDFGDAAYGGPGPPLGPPHRYFFQLFALDVPVLNLPAGARRGALERALMGRVLAKASTMGRYQRVTRE